MAKKSLINGWTILLGIILVVVGVLIYIAYMVYKKIKEAADAAAKTANDVGAIPGNIVKGAADAGGMVISGGAGIVSDLSKGDVGHVVEMESVGIQSITKSCGPGTTMVNHNGTVECVQNDQVFANKPTCPEGEAPKYALWGDRDVPYWKCEKTFVSNCPQGYFWAENMKQCVPSGGYSGVTNCDDPAVFRKYYDIWNSTHPNIGRNAQVHDVLWEAYLGTMQKVQWQGKQYTIIDSNQNIPGYLDDASKYLTAGSNTGVVGTRYYAGR